MISVLLAMSCCLWADENWTGFLGYGHRDAKPDQIPLEWSVTKNVAWKIETPGHGQSSPVVWKDRIIITAVEGPMKDKLHVLCYALADGKQLWQRTVATSDPVKDSFYVSRAAPTPVVDQDHVYAMFESGDIICTNHAGEIKWQRSLKNDFGKFQGKFGIGSSPAWNDQSLFVLIDDEGPSYLLALNKSDGKTKWKQDRTSRVSWSSPVCAKLAGVEQVVCSSKGSVDGYDAQTGKLLWTMGDVGGNTGATPIPTSDGKLLIGAGLGRQSENVTEAKKSNLCMTVEKSGDKFEPKVIWRAPQASVSWASPIIYRDHAYWVNGVGAVMCFDLKTGEQKYSERIKQSCWATPVGIGDRVYFFGKDGVTTVLATGPAFKQLANNTLWDKRPADPNAGAKEESPEMKRAAQSFAGETLYGVAVVDSAIVIRSGDRLYCVRQATDAKPSAN